MIHTNSSITSIMSYDIDQQQHNLHHVIWYLPTAAQPASCLGVLSLVTCSQVSCLELYTSMDVRLLAACCSPSLLVRPPIRYRLRFTSTRLAWHRGTVSGVFGTQLCRNKGPHRDVLLKYQYEKIVCCHTSMMQWQRSHYSNKTVVQYAIKAKMQMSCYYAAQAKGQVCSHGKRASMQSW